MKCPMTFNDPCDKGIKLVYCHYEKELIPCSDCYPCAECEPCSDCGREPCPYATGDWEIVGEVATHG